MRDLPPVVVEDKKAVQNTERESWDGEEVHRSNGLAVVSEGRQPSFHRIRGLGKECLAMDLVENR